jgi:CBS domain-containing protein
MLCEQAMQHPVQTLLEDDSLALAAERMRDTNVGFLPVCNTAGIAVGVITDRDIVVRALADQLPPSTPLSQVMTREVVACRPKDSLVRAIGMMRERHLSRVLCVDGVGRPMGVISLSQVVRYEDSMRMAKTVREIVTRNSTTTAA